MIQITLRGDCCMPAATSWKWQKIAGLSILVLKCMTGHETSCTGGTRPSGYSQIAHNARHNHRRRVNALMERFDLMKSIKINKPTHKFFGSGETPAIAIGQMRGSTLFLNRFSDGELIEKSWAVESCAFHLTNYGKGVYQDDRPAIERMQRAWRFTFGQDAELPVLCEVHKT